MKDETKIHLVTIDPQVDFHPGGLLPIAGADKDAERLAKMVDHHGHKLEDWHITFDLHNQIDVGHRWMWRDKQGKMPKEGHDFTYMDIFTISSEEIKAKEWNPIYEPWDGYFYDYAKKLEEGNRYALTVWPDHCLTILPGCCIYPIIGKAMLDWEIKNNAIVDKVTKGQNWLTEHYSALKAEVPFIGRPDLKINGDPNTQMNSKFVNTCKEADWVLYSGQAGSHCLRFTFEDMLKEFGPDKAKNMAIATDLTSAVTGFETQMEEFFHEVEQKGVLITTSEKFWKI